MTISNQASGTRPGVCTSTTRPTTPYTGMIIYETDTGYLRVWDGAAWDYLSQKQDTTEGLPAETYMGLVKVIPTSVTGGTLSATGTITVTSGNSLVVNGAFTSGYKNYRLICSDLTTNGTAAVPFQLTKSGTAAATAYYLQRLYVQNATVGGASSTNATSWNFTYQYPSTAQFATMDIFNPQITGFSHMNLSQIYTDNSLIPFIEQRMGSHRTSDSYDGFRITTTDTFTAGTITIYGYRN